MSRIAITGASSFLGDRVLRRLIREGHGDDLVVVDVAEPKVGDGLIHYRRLDLTEPAADQALLDQLRADDVSVLLHLAFQTNPRRDTTYAHELESIGTLAVFAAAAAAGVKRVVMRSFTAVYGPRGTNPALIREDSALPERASFGWLRDKVEAESHAASFARRYPLMEVAVLRFAPLFGPDVRSFYTRIFDRRLVPALFGYDPLFQLLHPDDAETAFMQAVPPGSRGAFNIVPRGVVPFLSAIHLSEKVPLLVPHMAAYPAVGALYASGLVEAPAGFIDYARYPFVADGSRAARELGFVARYSSRDALGAYLDYRHPERVASGSIHAVPAPRRSGVEGRGVSA
jgi:UDP-glucose 4-epimerase